jgi:hypothetical protein
MFLAVSLVLNVLLGDFPYHPLPDPYPHALTYQEQYKAHLQQQRASIDAFIDVRDSKFLAFTDMQSAVSDVLLHLDAIDPFSERFKKAQEAVAHAKFRMQAMQGDYIPNDLHGLKHAWLSSVWRAEEVFTRCNEVAILKQQQAAQAQGLVQEKRALTQWRASLQTQVEELLDHDHAPRLARRALASLRAFDGAHPGAAADAPALLSLEERVEAAIVQAAAYAERRSAVAWSEMTQWPLNRATQNDTSVCMPWAMQLVDSSDEATQEASFIAFRKRCQFQSAHAQVWGVHPWPLSFLPYIITGMNDVPYGEISGTMGVPWPVPTPTQDQIEAFSNPGNGPTADDGAYQPPRQPETHYDRLKREEAAHKEAHNREESRCQAIDNAFKGSQQNAVKSWQNNGKAAKRQDATEREAGIKAIKKLRQETARALGKTSKAEQKAYERANRALDDAWKKSKKSMEEAMARLEFTNRQEQDVLHWRQNMVRKSMSANLMQAASCQKDMELRHACAAHEVDVQRGKLADQARRSPLPQEVYHTGLPLGSRPTDLPGFATVQTPMGKEFLTKPGTPAWADLVATTDQYGEAQTRIERLDQKPLRQTMVDMSALMIHRADAYFGDGDEADGHAMLGQVRLVLDVAVDMGLAVMLPQVAIAKSIIQISTGKSLMTGQPLSPWELGMEAVNVVCLGHLSHVAQASTWLAKVVRSEGASARAAEAVLGHWRAADQAVRLERKALVNPEWVGEATYRGIMDGTDVGATYSLAVMETVGELTVSERAIARNFGGLQGVLAWRDPRVQEAASKWGTAWDGQNQLAVHLFRSHDQLREQRYGRLYSTEKNGGLPDGCLSQILDNPESEQIVEAYISFNKLAESVKQEALLENHHVNGKEEIWWREPENNQSSKAKGIAVRAYDGKNQTVLLFDKGSWKNHCKRYP